MKKKFEFSYSFFILAFTFSIFCFITTSTILESKLLYNQRYNSSNNKIINFNTSKSLPLNQFLNLFNEENLTITLSKFIYEDIDKDNSGYELVTKINSNKFDYHNNMLNGSYFSKSQFQSDENIALTTINKDTVKLIYSKDKKKYELPLSVVGTIVGESRTILVPNSIFLKYVSTTDLSLNKFSIHLSGSKEDISSSVSKIMDFSKTLPSLNDEPSIGIYFPISSSTTLESRFLILMTILIIFITFLNSICISYLWIEDRKKELCIRKVCGANNHDLFKLFFKELSFLSIISFLIANALYAAFIYFTDGILFGMNLKLSIFSISISLVFSFFIVYIVALPSIKYISNLKPIKILREE